MTTASKGRQTQANPRWQRTALRAAAEPQGRWTRRIATWIAVVLATAGPVCFAKEPEIYVKYSKFVALVERGRVISLSIDDTGKIEGVYRGTQGDLTFWTHRPGRPVEDTLLRRLLREHLSAVEFRAPLDPEHFLWMGLAGFLVDSIAFPVVTLVLLFRIFRRLKSLEHRLPD